PARNFRLFDAAARNHVCRPARAIGILADAPLQVALGIPVEREELLPLARVGALFGECLLERLDLVSAAILNHMRDAAFDIVFEVSQRRDLRQLLEEVPPIALSLLRLSLNVAQALLGL